MLLKGLSNHKQNLKCSNFKYLAVSTKLENSALKHLERENILDKIHRTNKNEINHLALSAYMSNMAFISFFTLMTSDKYHI